MKTREEIAAMEMLLDAEWLNTLGYFIRRDPRNRNNTIRFDENGNEMNAWPAWHYFKEKRGD